MIITPNEHELSAERRRSHRRYQRLRRLTERLMRERDALQEAQTLCSCSCSCRNTPVSPPG